MTRTCTICGHSEREAIDKALVSGDRAVFEPYGPPLTDEEMLDDEQIGGG